MIKEHYVYILKCVDGYLYTGYTIDLEKRLASHNAGKASKCTRGRLPVSIVYVENFSQKSDALRREYAIKQMTRTQKLLLIEEKKREEDD